jgi:flagellin
MRIQNNISALYASNKLAGTDNHLSKSLEKLSSGFRINRAADDAAGLAISEKMRAQIGGLNKAVQNAQNAISLVQTAEGALNESHSILQRMRDLAVQAANGTNTTSDRQKISDELKQLQSELTRISAQTEFNTRKLLDGTYKNVKYQIGANSGQFMTLTVSTMSATALSIKASSVSLSAGTAGAQISRSSALITTVDKAISTVSDTRSRLGSVQNRLQHTINNLQTAAENLTAAESRIRDVDMASEMVKFTKNQILLQAGTAMLAQANAKPQAVLQLLG